MEQGMGYAAVRENYAGGCIIRTLATFAALNAVKPALAFTETSFSGRQQREKT
jgi:hypothetical protein